MTYRKQLESSGITCCAAPIRIKIGAVAWNGKIITRRKPTLPYSLSVVSAADVEAPDFAFSLTNLSQSAPFAMNSI